MTKLNRTLPAATEAKTTTEAPKLDAGQADFAKKSKTIDLVQTTLQIPRELQKDIARFKLEHNINNSQADLLRTGVILLMDMYNELAAIGEHRRIIKYKKGESHEVENARKLAKKYRA